MERRRIEERTFITEVDYAFVMRLSIGDFNNEAAKDVRILSVTYADGAVPKDSNRARAKSECPIAGVGDTGDSSAQQGSRIGVAIQFVRFRVCEQA
jgi:hypothetical protein